MKAYVLKFSHWSCYSNWKLGTLNRYWVGTWKIWIILWGCFSKSKYLYNIWFSIKKKLAEFGEIEDLIVCENIGDHLVGNVYIKYTKEEYAEKCM
jgi:hypothetical protein